MALTLWNLFETSLLCLNAFTIINEERNFFGQPTDDDEDNLRSKLCFKNEESKTKIFNIISSLSTISKYPVIFLNIITILLKLILGS